MSEQKIEDIFLLPQSIYKWNTLPLFGNLIDIDEYGGTITAFFYDFDRVEKQCNQDCSTLHNPKNCTEYCSRLKKFYYDALSFASQECPTGNKDCCKKTAKNNDYAYLACIRNAKTTKKHTTDAITNLCISLIIFVIFLLICLIIKWIKKY
jgi:hypothetical protein